MVKLWKLSIFSLSLRLPWSPFSLSLAYIIWYLQAHKSLFNF